MKGTYWYQDTDDQVYPGSQCVKGATAAVNCMIHSRNGKLNKINTRPAHSDYTMHSA